MKTTQRQKSYDAKDRLGVLMQEVIVRQQQFDHPQEQSAYFKWGKENGRAILEGYIQKYEEKRALFNATSQAAFSYQLDQVEAEMQWIREARRQRTAGISSCIWLMGSLSGKRDRMEIFMLLKEFTDHLPPAEELRQHKELIARIHAAGL